MEKAHNPNVPLGIIAGSGAIPSLIIQSCRRAGRPVFVLAYHGHTDAGTVEGVPHAWLGLGEVGKALSLFREANIREVVFAGGVHRVRPSLRELSVDRKGWVLLSRIGLRWSGDNKILTTIGAFLEEEGFSLKSPQELFPPLVSAPGALGKVLPNDAEQADIHKAMEALKHLSVLDVGQGLAIQGGLILGIEAAEGTDQCIARCGALQRSGEAPAIYVKCAKKGQDEKIDLPVIGPTTVEHLAAAKFRGLAFQPEKTLILFPELMRARADEANIFLWGGA